MAFLNLNRNKVAQVVCGLDWGYTNPGVEHVWAVDRDGNMLLVHEIYMSHKTIEWWIAKTKEVVKYYHPQVWVADPSEPGMIASLEAGAGIRIRKADNDISRGIQAVQDRLKPRAGRVRLQILRNALDEQDEQLATERKPTCTEEEFDVYQWAKGQDGKPIKEEPIDMNNHGMDVTRYVTMFVDSQASSQWRLV